ncbi:MAG: hypothetical protein JXL80_12415 [Planctomycetes bacterium]|nr:hypothetical protein [Planctomycetota bacterium]
MTMQYFRPPDPCFVGDCMPFFHDGTFYVYWLRDENHHQGRGGLGGHEWWLMTSEDLVHWTDHGRVIRFEQEWERSFCTGSTFYHDGTFYAFYATRLNDHSEHLGMAIGTDGVRFEKIGPNPLASPGPELTRDYRDPFVFRDEETGLFHMLLATRRKAPSLHGRGGFLEHLVSRDLRRWEVVEPFLDMDLPGVPECPDYFAWNGWYYLLFSHGGIAHYRMSRQPLGPWTRPTVDMLNGPMGRVMKTAPFTGGRRIGVSFISWLADPADNDRWQWDGNMLFQELLQAPDGTLQSRFVPEMIPAAGEPLDAAWETRTSGVSADGSGCVTVASRDGRGAAQTSNVPQDVRVHLRVVPTAGTVAYGLCLRASNRCEMAAELRLCPSGGTVDLRSPSETLPTPTARHCITGVDGLDRPLTLDIVVKGNIVDVCVDERRCLVNRIPQLTGSDLLLFCDNGEATFEEIAVRPLT